jgi:hypothetical protein
MIGCACLLTGPNMFTTRNPAAGRSEQLLGIGQRSGVY